MLIHVGDTLPALSGQIRLNGAALNLTPATTTVSLRLVGPDDTVIEGAAVKAGGTGGGVSYAWQAGDTDVAGVYYGTWLVETAAGSFTQPGIDVVVYDPAELWATSADVENILGAQDDIEPVIAALVQAQQAINAWVTREIPTPVPQQVRRAHAIMAARVVSSPSFAAGGSSGVIQESIGDHSVRYARPQEAAAVLDPSMHPEVVKLLKPWAPSNYTSTTTDEAGGTGLSRAFEERLPASQVDYTSSTTVAEALDDLFDNGVIGPQGPVGPAGPAGSQGPAGAAGTAATVSVGSVTTGAAGSSATVTNTGTSSAAVLAFTIPQGATGAAGAAGAAGVDGKTIRSGAGAPAAGLGNDGDFYVDTTAKALYGPKASGAWGSATSLIGPTGPQGAPGTTSHSALTNLASDDHSQYQLAGSIIVGADHTIVSESLVLTVEDNVTVTLPDAASNDGRTFTVVAGGTGTSVAPAGTDTISFGSGADPIRINNVRSYTSVNFGNDVFAYIPTNVEGDVSNVPAWVGQSIPQGHVISMGASAPAWAAITSSQIPNLDAAKITSGTLSSSQIPNLDAAKITSGTIGTALLGSGTASSSTFLRGDGSWQNVSATNKATVVGGQDEGATVNQTASATSLLDSTITLPACAAGDVLIISGGLNIVQNSGAARTLTLGFKLGATTICSAATSFGAQSTARQSFFSIAVRVEATSDINASLLWSVGGVGTLGATGVATENIGTGSLALDLLITGTANATQTYQLQNISVVKVAA